MTVVALTRVAPVSIDVLFGDALFGDDALGPADVGELDEAPVLALDDVLDGELPEGVVDDPVEEVDTELLSAPAGLSAAADGEPLPVLVAESLDELDELDPPSEPVSALAAAAPAIAAAAMAAVSAPAPNHRFSAVGAEPLGVRDARCSSVEPPVATAAPTSPLRDAQPSDVDDRRKNLRRER